MNPHGLHDENHYTTAYDIYLFCNEAMKHEIFRELVTSMNYTVPATNMSEERTFWDTNALITSWKYKGYTYEYATGIKTGYTPEAGYCLASSATRSHNAPLPQKRPERPPLRQRRDRDKFVVYNLL